MKVQTVIDVVEGSWLPHKSIIRMQLPYTTSITRTELKTALSTLPSWVYSNIIDMIDCPNIS